MFDPIDVILKNEGGFQQHPKDKGNYYKGKLIGTNFGISAPVLAEWLDRDITVDDMKSLKEDEAREIYETKYLSGPRIHTLPEPPQTFVLDMSVNHGPKTAIRLLQKVINLAGFGPVDVDGVMGPQTRSAAQKAQKEMGNYFQNALVDERIKFYQEIARNDSTQAGFLNGWINRANTFRLPV